MNINADSSRDEILRAIRERGIDAPDGEATKEELLSLLSSVTGEDYSKRQSPAKATRGRGRKRKMRTIIIPSGDSKATQGDVFIGHNGQSFLIRRDEEVEVPEEVVAVLRDAQTTVGRPTEDGGVEYHKVPTYPFSVVA